MLEGYHRRWEAEWQHTRHILAMLHNVNRGKGKALKPAEMLPLPSEIRAESEIIEIDGRETTLKEWRAQLRIKAEINLQHKNRGAGTTC